MTDIIACHRRLWFLHANAHGTCGSNMIVGFDRTHHTWLPVVLSDDGTAYTVHIDSYLHTKVAREVKLASEFEKFVREVEGLRARRERKAASLEHLGHLLGEQSA